MQQEKKFDYNQLIGFVLLGILFIVYMWWTNKNAPKEDKKAVQTAQVTTKSETDSAIATLNTATISQDTINQKIVTNTFSNPKLNIAFNSKGGQLKSVELKEYKAYSKEAKGHKKPLEIVKDNSVLDIEVLTTSGKTIHTKDLFFSPQISKKDSTQIITYTTQIEKGTLQFIYSISNTYKIDFEVKSDGIVFANQKAKLDWKFKAFQLEKGRTQELSFTDIHYGYDNYQSTDYNSSSELDEPEETLNWVCAKQQFFLSILENQNGFTQSTGKVTTIELDEKDRNGKYLKDVLFNADLKSTSNINEKFTWYFMPMNLDLLTQTQYEEKRFDDLVPMDYLHSGFIGWINKHFFYNIYKYLTQWGLSAGIAILVMTLIMKLLLFPIMFKQNKQSAVMRVLKPEMDELNEKNKDKDAMAKQQATMELYRKAGVNPMAGCIPALIQVPLFMALFRLFPNIIQMRGESFLWADDLTSYDSIYSWNTHIWGLSSFYGNHISLFALLYCVVLLIYTRMTANNIQQPTQEGMPDMKKLMYIMPVMFVFFLNSYASGLSWYYVVSNIINIFMILFITKFLIDETKIHAQIQENKKKPAKKKGKFAQLMEQAAEQQRKNTQAQEKLKNMGKKK